MSLIEYASFINCDTLANQINVIDILFEPSSSILKFTIRDGSFMQIARNQAKSYTDFIELVRARLLRICKDTEEVGPSSRDVDRLADIVAAHPRLGEPPKNLSVHSKNEQQNLQNNRDSVEIREKIVELNHAYEKAYPGLQFVVFVNGRSRPEIISVMQQRIASKNSWFEEVRIAINELCDIAQDRAHKWEAQSAKCKY